ncbi:MAG: DUF948 domain-containing protein [Candidatus Methylomirabilales bacterium]
MDQPVLLVIAIALVLMAGSALIAAIAAIPVLRQMRETLRRLEDLIRAMDMELRPTLANVREVAANMNKASAGVQVELHRVRGTVDALATFGETIRNTSDIIRGTLHPRLLTLAGMVVGLRTGTWHLLRKYLIKRR